MMSGIKNGKVIHRGLKIRLDNIRFIVRGLVFDKENSTGIRNKCKQLRYVV